MVYKAKCRDASLAWLKKSVDESPRSATRTSAQCEQSCRTVRSPLNAAAIITAKNTVVQVSCSPAAVSTSYCISTQSSCNKLTLCMDLPKNQLSRLGRGVLTIGYPRYTSNRNNTAVELQFSPPPPLPSCPLVLLTQPLSHASDAGSCPSGSAFVSEGSKREKKL